MDSSAGYDYVINLSTLKRIRVKDPFTMRMLKTNVVNTVSTLKAAQLTGARNASAFPRTKLLTL